MKGLLSAVFVLLTATLVAAPGAIGFAAAGAAAAPALGPITGFRTSPPTNRFAFTAGLEGSPFASAGVAGSAATIVPPAGTPDLSQMVLQRSDFTATTVANEGYQSDPGFVALYERDFGSSTTAGGAAFLAVVSEVALATDSGAAASGFAALETALKSPSGRASLVQTLVTSTGRLVRKKDIRIGRVQDLGVGDGALLVPIGLRVRRVRVQMDLISLHRDRVLGVLVLMGLPGKGINVADASTLANTTVSHVNLGLSPHNTALPTISGTAAPGQTLTGTTGSWTNGATDFAYQWQRCDPTGANCQPITGATANTYTVTSGDSGSTLRMAVTAKNNVGSSAPVSSSPTTRIR